MEKKYKAIVTKSFYEGQTLADIVQGRTYLADKEAEYFIGEFGEAIYLSKDNFDEHFKPIKQKSYQAKAKRNYQKRAAEQGKQKILFITLYADKDADIIEKLEQMKETEAEKKESKGSRGGKTEYIRRLIREDIAKENI